MKEVKSNQVLLNNKFDYGPAKIMQISNDAYFYFTRCEPCIDAENYAEIKEIKGRFPSGFKIEKIDTVEDSDLIEIKLYPIIELDTPYEYYKLTAGWFKSEFYYLPGKKHVYYRTYNPKQQKFREYGLCKVTINEQGKPEIQTEGCIFPLWGKSWIKYPVHRPERTLD